MGFKCGLVGLPNVGKSTIFNALTSLHVPASNYPFCTMIQYWNCPLNDDGSKQLEKLSDQPKSPTTLEFIDIAGLVKGASRGRTGQSILKSHSELMPSLMWYDVLRMRTWRIPARSSIRYQMSRSLSLS